MPQSLSQAVKSFFDEVERIEGLERRQSYEPILIALIDWSQQSSLSLTFKPPIEPKPGKRAQHTVGFQVNSTEVLWNAFPRKDGGAKIDITARDSVLLNGFRKELHAVACVITGEPPREDSKVPIIPFSALENPGAFTTLTNALESVLHRI